LFKELLNKKRGSYNMSYCLEEEEEKEVIADPVKKEEKRR
jgi:hypothetical protein